MKKYVLGNLELSLYDSSLLLNCILDRIGANEEFICSTSYNKLKALYEIENKHLECMVDELKRIGD